MFPPHDLARGRNEDAVHGQPRQAGGKTQARRHHRNGTNEERHADQVRNTHGDDWTGMALVAGVILWQPFRLSESTKFFKYPQYQAMRLASYALTSRAPALRDIRVTLEVHPTMDKYFMYRILGGRMDSAAAQTAFVNADGSMRIE